MDFGIFLTVDQNNFRNKTSLFYNTKCKLRKNELRTDDGT